MPYKNIEDQKEHQKLYYLKNKESIKVINKRWHDNNLERHKKAVRAYYDNHKQSAIDAAKRWKERNPEKVKEGHRLYKEKNREKLRIKQREYRKKTGRRCQKAYREKNRDKILQKNKEYRDNHRDEARSYVTRRRKEDIQYKLKLQLRHRLYCALKGNFKSGSAVKDLGCTIPKLKVYLEKKFQPGMTWGNWTLNGWHIDHKIPLDKFDLTDREQLLKAVNFSNLQPMWAIDNIRKSNKIII